MSSPQQPPDQAGLPVPAAGPSAKPEVYRSPGAVVIWWLWVAFAAANLIDLVVQGHGHFAVEVAAVLILITGVAYVAALRPRIVADDAGITVVNPFREHRVPWGSVDSVDLAESLRVQCSWATASGTSTKKLYGWAIQSSSRSRMRAQTRARRRTRAAERRGTATPPPYGQLPPEIREAMNRSNAEQACAELSERATRSRPASVPGAAPKSRWSRLAIAAVLIPALVLVVVILA